VQKCDGISENTDCTQLSIKLEYRFLFQRLEIEIWMAGKRSGYVEPPKSVSSVQYTRTYYITEPILPQTICPSGELISNLRYRMVLVL